MYDVRLGHDRRKAGNKSITTERRRNYPLTWKKGNVLDPQTHGYIPSAVPPAVGHFECKKARRQGARTVVRACIDQRLVSALSFFFFSLSRHFLSADEIRSRGSK